MNCREAQKQLAADSGRASGDAGSADLAQHLAACPACRQTRDALVSAITSWQDETRAVAVPDAESEWQDLRRQLRNDVSITQRRNPLAWLAIPLTAAAAAAVAFLAAPGRNEAAANGGRQIARAEFVEVRGGNASTTVFVDDKSGWLIVWATDANATL